MLKTKEKITFEAVYEGGKLNPLSPLNLTENQKVQVIINLEEEDPIEKLYGYTQGIGLTDKLLKYREEERNREQKR